MATSYPEWFYFPAWTAPPAWVTPLVDVIGAARVAIDSGAVSGLTSNKVLAAIRPRLLHLGFEVESGQTNREKIRRPVLFGPQGHPQVEYQVDGWHAEHKVLVEVEARRVARGNAVYRDLIRTSLIVDAEYLALGVPKNYKYGATRLVNVESYRESRDTIAAIYESRRLILPFKGILLFRHQIFEPLGREALVLCYLLLLLGTEEDLIRASRE